MDTNCQTCGKSDNMDSFSRRKVVLGEVRFFCSEECWQEYKKNLEYWVKDNSNG